MLAARRSGIRARVLAERYGLSVRTIYRYLAGDHQGTVLVQVGRWQAPFSVNDGLRPKLMGPWRLVG